MGVVVDYIECARCKSEAINEYWYQTGEEVLTCPFCGYRHAMFLNDRGVLTEEEIRPYATYRVRFKGDKAYECGFIETEQDISKVLQAFEEQKDGLEHAQYSYWDGSQIQLVVLKQES